MSHRFDASRGGDDDERRAQLRRDEQYRAGYRAGRQWAQAQGFGSSSRRGGCALWLIALPWLLAAALWRRRRADRGGAAYELVISLLAVVVLIAVVWAADWAITEIKGW